MIDKTKTYKSNNCGEFKIINHTNANNIEIEFLSTGYRKITRHRTAMKGEVKDKYHPCVNGVGFIGDGSHKVSVNCVQTKAYEVWSGMISRCYSKKTQERQPSYIGCTVCREWHNFQNFAEWFDGNYIDGMCLDKDIRVKGNKVYSPDTCKFVTKSENTIAATARSFCLASPDGLVVNVFNMAKFCRDNNLTSRAMSKVISGEQKHHKGWSIYMEELTCKE